MLAQVQTARIGLTGLGVAIAAEVDPTLARAKYRQIFGDYRVYLLLTPKVDAAMRCAHDLDRISHARASMARVQQRVAVLVGRGVDVAAMNSALATANALLVRAEAKSRAAASSVAGLVPDQFDAARLAANNAALVAARAEFKAVDELIKQAKHWIGVANSNAGTATRTVSRPITVPRDTKVHDKSARDAEKAAEKAAEKLAREAEKAARDAQKAAEKAARDAAKADRQSDEDEGNDKGNDKGRGRNNDH